MTMTRFTEETDEAITQINIVPLVDIMLVLLIIFMLTASFISTPSIPVQVPKAYTSNPTAPASQSLVLTAKGELFYSNKPVTRQQLAQTLEKAVALNPELRIVLSADASASHGQVVQLLDLARKAGVAKIALAVARP
jgi:biopolymer transport protein ExbD